MTTNKSTQEAVRERLEYLRGELRAERISWGELHELQGLADYIEPGDVELLEAAGVPEFKENATYTVSLELPDCEGDNPLEAVRNFQASSEQRHLFAYGVEDERTHERFVVDMSDESITPADPEEGR